MGCLSSNAPQFMYPQVSSWMEEVNPGVSSRIISYIIGVDSLRATDDTIMNSEGNGDIRLRLDGLFEQENHAVQFIKEFMALYTNGPAGGGGIRLVFTFKTLSLHLRTIKRN